MRSERGRTQQPGLEQYAATNHKKTGLWPGQTADEPRVFAGFRFSGVFVMILQVSGNLAC